MSIAGGFLKDMLSKIESVVPTQPASAPSAPRPTVEQVAQPTLTPTSVLATVAQLAQPTQTPTPTSTPRPASVLATVAQPTPTSTPRPASAQTSRPAPRPASAQTSRPVPRPAPRPASALTSRPVPRPAPRPASALTPVLAAQTPTPPGATPTVEQLEQLAQPAQTPRPASALTPVLAAQTPTPPGATPRPAPTVEQLEQPTPTQTPTQTPIQTPIQTPASAPRSTVEQPTQPTQTQASEPSAPPPPPSAAPSAATAETVSERVDTPRDLRGSPSPFAPFAPSAPSAHLAMVELSKIKEAIPYGVDLVAVQAAPTGQAPVPVAEQAAELEAPPAPAQPLVTAKLAEVSQLSDDLLYNMLESISYSTDSTLLPNAPIVLDNIQKNIGDDDNYLLSFKQYGFNEEPIDYQIYYKQNELSNVKPNFLDKSFNYFVYSLDEQNVKITPIKKYYTLKDILKQIYKLFDNIIIISKNISPSPISVLHQYKDYTHNSLIFIYDSNNNGILKNIEGFIDIIPENTLPDNPISIDEYNSIKTDIYGLKIII